MDQQDNPQASGEASFQHHLMEGERAFVDQDWEKALGHFRKVIEASPGQKRAFEGIRECYALRGDISSLIDHLSWQAQYFLSQKMYSEAIAILEQIVRIKPDHYFSRLMIADITREIGRQEDALSQFLHWGRTFRVSGMLEEALLFMQNAYEMNTRDVAIAHEIADILVEVKHPAQAMRFYHHLAVECLKKGFIKDAKTALKASARFSAEPGKTTLEHLSFLAGQVGEGVPLKGLLSLEFDEVLMLREKAEAKKKEGLLEEAAALYGVITAIEPEAADIHELLGDLACGGGDIRSAAGSFLTSAEHYASKGNIEKARALYEKVLEIDQENGIALYKLGELGGPS
ncbi:MAG: hypothetical protein RDV48_07405 [Candidatus Eremiobacteraeota bacterium]|nr:hypothetical protein [Candidatus Eremiobacteraeota bacterium]